MLYIIQNYIAAFVVDPPAVCSDMLGHCYWRRELAVKTGQGTWGAAVNVCREEGGDLAHVHTQQIHQFLDVNMLTDCE